MPDPDLEIRGAGGNLKKKKKVRPFGPQFGLKIRGEGRGRAPPLGPFLPVLLTTKDCKGPQTNMQVNVDLISKNEK